VRSPWIIVGRPDAAASASPFGAHRLALCKSRVRGTGIPRATAALFGNNPWMAFPARLGGARNVTGGDADRGHPDADQVFGGQLRQDLAVDIVVAERRYIALKF
jgi:hypothetical protein